MADSRLDGRFSNLVRVVNQSCKALSNATTTANRVYGSQVTLEAGEVQPGLSFRWTLTGTKTGGNATFTVALWASNASSALLTLTSDAAASEADWTAEIVMVHYGGALQKLFGTLNQDTQDPDVDYAAGTNNAQAGVTYLIKMASGHTSDTITVESCVTESWVAPLEDA